MLKAFRWFFGLFSRYVHPFEKKVDKFFRALKSTDSHLQIERDLLNLMQENLVILSIWLEKKFKGYRYLKKSRRREMYKNLQKIILEFEKFKQENIFSKQEIKKNLENLDLKYPKNNEKELEYLAQIMDFLRPGKFFNYVQSASFGKLLSDPASEKLEGDCNQIVTFYSYLYSLRFPLVDLQIKLLPEHVCLHFKGIDIEATAGQFMNYRESNQVLPITEIVSTNLLDITDFRETLEQVSAHDIVKASQLAYAISSLKPLVAKNLEIAYHNLALAALKIQNFDKATFYAEKTNDFNLQKHVFHNAAVYYFEKHNFKKALFYAEMTRDGEFVRSIKNSEYSRQYNELLQKVKNDKTLKDLKNHKSIYLSMLELTQKMEDNALEENVRKVLKQI